jgi:hypothetical protein
VASYSRCNLPCQAPTAVSQFTTQAVNASLCGLVDGSVKAGGGTVTVCWARAPSTLTVRKLRKVEGEPDTQGWSPDDRMTLYHAPIESPPANGEGAPPPGAPSGSMSCRVSLENWRARGCANILINRGRPSPCRTVPHSISCRVLRKRNGHCHCSRELRQNTVLTGPFPTLSRVGQSTNVGSVLRFEIIRPWSER